MRKPGTGKSWLAGLLCEQLILQGYSVCVIDPEGDYRSLEALPGVMMLGGEDPPPSSRELARALAYSDMSLVIDLSRLSHQAKLEYVDALLPLLATLRRSTGLPHKILLDEAHYFLNGADANTLIDPELAGYILVTYRISALDPGIRTPCDAVVLVTRETDPAEIDTLTSLCRPQPSDAPSRGLFADLHPSEAVLLPGPVESQGGSRRFTLAPRLTEHVRHRSSIWRCRSPRRTHSYSRTAARPDRAPPPEDLCRPAQHAARRPPAEPFSAPRLLAMDRRGVPGSSAGEANSGSEDNANSRVDAGIAGEAIAQAIRARYETVASSLDLVARSVADGVARDDRRTSR